MVQALKSVTTFIVLGLIVGIFVFLITDYVIEISNSPNAALSNSSEEYISEITGGDKRLGFNVSIYDDVIGDPTVTGSNDNKNEFSIDFNYGRQSSSRLKRYAYISANIPEFLIIDLFKISTLKWLADIFDWFFRIMLFIALYILIRKGDG